MASGGDSVGRGREAHAWEKPQAKPRAGYSSSL